MAFSVEYSSVLGKKKYYRKMGIMSLAEAVCLDCALGLCFEEEVGRLCIFHGSIFECTEEDWLDLLR